MRQRKIFMALVLPTLLTASAWATSRGKLTVDLWLDWESIASPQISPDGSQIVYTRRWTDKVNDKDESDVWIVNSDGSKNRFLVKGSSPEWSPDGKRIVYVANGQPSGAQIFVKWMDTGEENQQTHLQSSPSHNQRTPDGERKAI